MTNGTSWAWVGGDPGPVPLDGARIPLLDEGYLHGFALYETLRTYRSVPFAADRHLARLRAGGTRIGLESIPIHAIAEAVAALARLRKPADSCLRVFLSPSADAASPTPHWTAMAEPLRPHVAAYYERGVRCILSSRRRWNPGGYVPAVKFTGNPDLTLARREAAAAGAFEALVLNPEGDLAEGASSTVFMIRDRRLVTPHLDGGILDGVTRSILLELAPKAGIEAEERRVAPGELFEAEEVFLASTLKEVVPVVAVDGRAIGPGTPGLITDRLLGLLQEFALESTRGDAP